MNIDQSLSDIIRNGVYYYPAHRHYGSDQMSVQCDFCKKINLTACIG